MTDDPYLHHPQLRGQIRDAETSFFRTFRPSDFDAKFKAMGAPDDWRYSDEQIEAARAAFLAGREGRDLWVFGYGSLMWDPALRFAEVRRGRLEGYARRFCLKDVLGGRGSRDAPGLMAALDVGAGCEGMVFRIPRADFDEETGILWRREMIAHAYRPLFAPVATALGVVEALTFVADHTAAMICPDLCRAEQARYLATGTGELGTSLQYIETLVAQLALLGIDDAEMTALLAAARAVAADMAGAAGEAGGGAAGSGETGAVATDP